MKTHYELLGLEPTADADAIKKAFRREIARYHPDKVIHLGAEFQEMAATRGRGAHGCLQDADRSRPAGGVRRECRRGPAAAAHAGAAPPAPRPEAPDDASPFKPPTIDEIRTPLPPRGNPGRFASERADRDVILRRAIAGRVHATVEALYGKVETPTVRGFDLAMVPLAKARFLGTPPPRVLVKVVGLVDAAAITEAWNAASRARMHAGKSPVVVLLFSRRIAPGQRAVESVGRHRAATQGARRARQRSR